MIIRAVHNKENPYFQFNRASIEDNRLSFKAVGILAYLLSKPDNWTIREADLVKRHTDGATAVRSGLRELKDHGYLHVVSIRGENGKIESWEQLVFETPKTDEEVANLLDKSHNVGKPQCGSSTKWETSAIVNNELLVNNEGSEMTLKAAASGARPAPDEGFVIDDKIKPRETSYTYRTAQRILTVLATHRGVKPSTVNLYKWAEDLRKFMIRHEITREEIDPVLDWWEQNIDDTYTPQVFAVKSFVDKFERLRHRSRQIPQKKEETVSERAARLAEEMRNDRKKNAVASQFVRGVQSAER